MQTIQAITKQVLKKYDQSSSERDATLKEVDMFVKKVKTAIQRAKITATVELGGSAAKGTFLKHDFDCDIFVRFDYEKYKTVEISKLLTRALQDIKPKKVHGSRDYFQKKHKGINYEIIPVLYVTEPNKAQNVTDMSPLHVRWVQKCAKKNTRNEIILTKLFCKAQNVYGAESYINGFSGHVLDILIIYYGSFEKLMIAATEWDKKEIIDVQKHYSGKEEILKTLNTAKLKSPLILVDPVQPRRNAAAAVSQEKYDLFIDTCNQFLEEPNTNFFDKKNFSIAQLRKETKGTYTDGKLHLLDVKPYSGKEDIVGTKLLKLFVFIKEELKRNKFVVWDAGWHWNKAKESTFWYVIKDEVLSATKTHMGPPLKIKKDAESFKEKHSKDCFEKNERLYATVKRPFRKPEQLIKELISGSYAKEKARSVKVEE